MSHAEIIMSSPPRSRSFATAVLSSSSPYLPSLEELYSKKSSSVLSSRPGEPSAFLPADARIAPTTAADIIREAPEIDIDTEKITKSPSRRVKPTNSRTHRPSTPERLNNGYILNRTAGAVPSLSPKDKPWQKFKQAPPAQDDEDPFVSMDLKALELKKRPRACETVSRHFAKKVDNPIPRNNAQAKTNATGTKTLVDEGTALEPAMPRRWDWTPPKANEPIVLDSDSDARELFSSVDRMPASKDVFQSLYDEYGRQDTDTIPNQPQQSEADVFRKRKRIEFISTGQNKNEEQSLREPLLQDPQPSRQQKKATEANAPAPRKKTRTITELAMAPFAAPAAPEFIAGPDTEESMLAYFDSDGAVQALVEHQTTVMSQRKSKGKAAKEPSKTTRKRKSGTQENPILLSPSSALKQSSDQDFVFGTSSQLIQEESPTLLRELQVALRESNNPDSSASDNARHRLWQAGARDEFGKLVGSSAVGLRHSSSINETNQFSTPADQSFVDIDDLLDSPVPVNLAPSEVRKSARTNSQILPQAQGQSSSTVVSEAERLASATNIEPRPKYELFTDAQLSKQITTYGFKPVKKRTAMIALLDQCWQSKHRQGAPTNSIQSLAFSTQTSMQAKRKSSDKVDNEEAAKPKGRSRAKKSDDEKTTVSKRTASDKASPKKPRGRPKNEETIPTSTESPKKPRGRPRNVETTPTPEETPKRSGSRSKKSETTRTSTPSPKRSGSRSRKSKKTRTSTSRERSSSRSWKSKKTRISTPSPKRSGSRSRKSSTASIEIPDSANGSPSPMSSPSPIDLTVSDEEDLSLALSPTHQQTQIFNHITSAVTSAPPSQDPSEPSWHEKMLLYDPVILEDLTVWLNSGELTRVGYDGEVDPITVKKWCEKKSIMWIWRETSKGGKRKRL